MRKRIAGILFWSIISAAFIGPGTVTTAARSGADFGLSLLWALLFGVIACLILQEAAARLTLGSKQSLGSAISTVLKDGTSASAAKFLVIGAIFFGCAAYQAGNILGAVSGLEVVIDLPMWLGAIIVTCLAGVSLWFGQLKLLQNLMSILVAVMGFIFFILALQLPLSTQALFQGIFILSLPNGSELIAIGLIGTTIVPYNLFLASGISKDQSISEMRFGLSTAIILGGCISMAILVVGSQLTGTFSFQALAVMLDEATGGFGHMLLGIGLFCAGFTSCITAPLAAAITWQSVSGNSPNFQSRSFRLVWGSIMGIGLIFGISGSSPIPIILLAQSLNGILLPISALFLLRVVNEPKLLSPQFLNTSLQNSLMMLVVSIAVFLGLHSLGKVMERLIPAWTAEGYLYFSALILLAFGVVLASFFSIRARNI